jgi:hypothetical protein
MSYQQLEQPGFAPHKQATAFEIERLNRIYRQFSDSSLLHRQNGTGGLEDDVLSG